MQKKQEKLGWVRYNLNMKLNMQGCSDLPQNTVLISDGRACLDFCDGQVAGGGLAGSPGYRAEAGSDMPATGSTCSTRKKILHCEAV